ncbi:hypothetical protein KAI54_00150, partial [Candidatus Gracilibacteria bacterium]|nr:hypothetical protein [Candidatus Gracilibacteria bacterium]
SGVTSKPGTFKVNTTLSNPTPIKEQTSPNVNNIGKVHIVKSIPLPLDDTKGNPLWTNANIVDSIPLPLDDTKGNPLWTNSNIVDSIPLPLNDSSKNSL